MDHYDNESTATEHVRGVASLLFWSGVVTLLTPLAAFAWGAAVDVACRSGRFRLGRIGSVGGASRDDGGALMFFKWLKKNILLGVIGFGAIWYIEHTGDKSGAIIGSPGHYQDGHLFMIAVGAGFVLTIFGSFTSRRDGSLISGLGLLLMVGAVLWAWGV